MKKIMETITFVDIVQDVLYDKVGNYCHLTGKYRGSAHKNCNINVTQKQSYSISVLFHNFSNFDCHLFFLKS